MGARDRGLLQLLDSPGVLHNPRSARIGIAGWRLARAGIPFGSKQRAAQSRKRSSSTGLFVFGLIAFIAGMYLLSISHLPSRGADLAEQLRKNPQDYDLSLGHVLDLTPRALRRIPRPAGRVAGFSVGDWAELDSEAAGSIGTGEHGSGGDDGGPVCVCAFLIQHLFADSFLVQTRGGDSTTLPPGRCNCC